jgi:lysozyme
MVVKPMGNPQPGGGPRTSNAVIGAGFSAIGLAATLLIAPWEGKRNDPYLDIVKVPTVCYGETQVAMRRYSDAECASMLGDAVGGRYAPKVYACVPGLRTRPYPAAASISLAYNIGTAGFCRSTAARRFNAGDWRGGCTAFGSWVKVTDRRTGKARVVPGLVNRRRAEIVICLKGVT